MLTGLLLSLDAWENPCKLRLAVFLYCSEIGSLSLEVTNWLSRLALELLQPFSLCLPAMGESTFTPNFIPGCWDLNSSPMLGAASSPYPLSHLSSPQVTPFVRIVLFRDGWDAQWVKVPAGPEDLGLLPWLHRRRRELTPTSVPVIATQGPWHVCTHMYTHGIKIKNKKWCFAICVCQSIFSFSILCLVFSSFFLVRLVNYLLKLLYCFVCFFPVTHPFLSLLCLTLPLPCLSFASVSLWAYTGLELILRPGLGFPARVPMPSFERLSLS